MANGHARTLRAIHDAAAAANFVVLRHWDTFFSHLTRYLATDPSIVWGHIKVALLGQVLQKDTIIPTNDKPTTFKDLVARGVYINSSREMVPRLSLLHIKSQFLSDYSENDQTFQALYDLCMLDPPSALYNQALGSWFELHHSHWESLKRLVALDDINQPQQVSLIHTIYGPFGLSTSQTSIAVLLHGADTTIEIAPRPKLPVKSVKHLQSLDNLVVDYESIFHLGGVNPGFDILIFEKGTDGEPVTIMIECKYSSPESVRPSEFGEVSVKSKIESCLHAFSSFRRLFSFFFLLLFPTDTSPSEQKMVKSNWMSRNFTSSSFRLKGFQVQHFPPSRTNFTPRIPATTLFMSARRPSLISTPQLSPVSWNSTLKRIWNNEGRSHLGSPLSFLPDTDVSLAADAEDFQVASKSGPPVYKQQYVPSADQPSSSSSNSSAGPGPSKQPIKSSRLVDLFKKSK